ncbi:MAG: COX15/CtaA family protein [Gammaproteobacteria bacterium]|nr:COX15/CtaA family protein [Gammaproteobacteria bacterium]MBU2059189.1 COX15/CtaA family protein [Gammaproteobacteria bacterium]MBU2173740.1 COX15/CtaA family protein [Gammaproteobacteria bacterium]MBU2246896.1 COX15/CtaA family protein [Gammaproteobacteria bacterium]MBU2343466.1 COX15/CtaA family protein [Gammaproteobacteria bacterium]
MITLQRLVTSSIILAMLVILLGAYTRLTDAGLGCPDWPGCYGFLKVPQQAHHIEQAQALFPERPLESHKAWNEMIHRYFAGTLGLLILAIFLFSLKQKRLLLPSLLLGLVIFQAALGMWTVTLALHPVIVMGHLLGGFTLLSLLAMYWWQLQPAPFIVVKQSLKLLFWPVLLVLVAQIALGGWTAANYAALSCIQLPVCEPGWTNQLNFDEAFSLHLGYDSYEYGVMSQSARATVHVMHRIGAVITLVVVAAYAIALWRSSSGVLKKLALVVLALLVLQFSLGLANVVLHLPLGNAVAHNFVAANLVMCLVVIGYQLHRNKESAYA